MKISRRDFIKRGTRVGLALGLSPVVPSWALEALDPGTGPVLSVVRGPTGEAVKRAIHLLGGIGAFVKRGDGVLLKPNLSFATSPDSGATTSPDVIRAVAELCLDAGAKRVLVIDNPLRAPEACRQKTGVEAACKGLNGVTILMPTQRSFYTEVEVPNGKTLRRVEVATAVEKSDVLINIPTAKSHSATEVSLGMKNLMGLIWDRRYFHRETNLNAAIAELSTVIRPNLTLVDASRALLDGGPGGPGQVKKLQTIVAGTDPVAVDSYVTGLVPWHDRSLKGHEVRHIKAAHQLGLGEIDTATFQLKEVDLG